MQLALNNMHVLSYLQSIYNNHFWKATYVYALHMTPVLTQVIVVIGHPKITLLLQLHYGL